MWVWIVTVSYHDTNYGAQCIARYQFNSLERAVEFIEEHASVYQRFTLVYKHVERDA